MKINKKLLLIFLFVFLFRLFFVFQVDYFSDDSSYSYVRQLNYVKDNLKPMTYDELSYGGKEALISPLFPYLLSLFSLVPFGLKIIPQLIISLLVFIVYLLAKQIVDDENSALLSSLLAGFMPLSVIETLNKLSIYFLAIPLIFYLIYSIHNIKNIKHKIGFFASSLLISLLDPIFVILVFVLLFYLLLLYVEDIEISKLEVKTILIFAFIIFAINLILLKDAILLYKLDFIYKNIPKALLVNTFKQLNVLTLIYNLGYIPLLLGGVAIYYGITRQKSKIVFLLSSLILITFSLLALKLIAFYAGLILIGISASILSALTINKLFLYLNMTKLSRYNYLFVSMFLFFILLLSVYPSYSAADRVISSTTIKDEIESLVWINTDSTSSDVVLGTIYQGNLITLFSGRKNLMDTSFLFAPDVAQRLIDANAMFTLDYERASPILKKYNIKYIFLSNMAKDLYGIKELKYADSKCLERHSFVYKVIC